VQYHSKISDSDSVDFPRVRVPGICLRASAASYAKGFFSNKLVSRIFRASRDSELLEQVDLNLFHSSLMLNVSYSVLSFLHGYF
jgi:hypothetical protein